MDKIKYALLIIYCVLFAVVRFIFRLVVNAVSFIVRAFTTRKLLRLPNQTVKKERGLNAPYTPPSPSVTPEEAYMYGLSAGMTRARSEAAKRAAIERWKKRKD